MKPLNFLKPVPRTATLSREWRLNGQCSPSGVTQCEMLFCSTHSWRLDRGSPLHKNFPGMEEVFYLRIQFIIRNFVNLIRWCQMDKDVLSMDRHLRRIGCCISAPDRSQRVHLACKACPDQGWPVESRGGAGGRMRSARLWQTGGRCIPEVLLLLRQGS